MRKLLFGVTFLGTSVVAAVSTCLYFGLGMGSPNHVHSDASHSSRSQHVGISLPGVPDAHAQDQQDGQQAVGASAPQVEISRSDILAGLWRDGQAVFSDIPLLDLFIKDHYARGYKPEQPINYSHVIHVKQNGIECQYCHSGVSKSSYPTIPAVEVCMGCHSLVKTDSPEIKKLADHWEKKIPVEWVPVHNLPEHANFNHERHVKAGVGCQNCHGQVQNMDVVERVSTLKMGFCVSCHRDQGVSIDCGICHY